MDSKIIKQFIKIGTKRMKFCVFAQGQRIDILRFIKFWCISTYTLKTCQSTVKIETTITTKIHPFSNKTTTNSLFTLPRSVPPLSPNYNPDLKLSARKGKYLFTYPPPFCSSPLLKLQPYCLSTFLGVDYVRMPHCHSIIGG